jgi:CRP-like cAMP-binding protein
MSAAQLVGHDVFSFLRPEQIATISNASNVATYKAGETVYVQGTKAQFLHVVLEGEVALRLPGKGSVSVLIDQLGPGAMFGTSLGFAQDRYKLTAQCLSDCRILKIETAVLRRLMDEDLRMGYAIQKRISELYFNRYVETMQKLQAIVMTIPLQAA